MLQGLGVPYLFIFTALSGSANTLSSGLFSGYLSGIQRKVTVYFVDLRAILQANLSLKMDKIDVLNQKGNISFGSSCNPG